MRRPTAIQGSVEEWVVQNRTQEVHEFHFHQLHFLVESQDNFELNGSPQTLAITGQFLDMIQGRTGTAIPPTRFRASRSASTSGGTMSATSCSTATSSNTKTRA